MTSIDSLLRENGIDDVSEDSVINLFGTFLRRAATPPAALTESEHAALARYTADTSADPATQSDTLAVEIAARHTADVLATTIGVREAASHLRLDRSSINRRINRGTLYAITVDGYNRLPTWQFLPSGEVLPGLTAVIAAIPRNYPPEVIAARVSTPREELGHRSIVDFLAAGGDPALPAQLVAELDQW